MTVDEAESPFQENMFWIIRHVLAEGAVTSGDFGAVGTAWDAALDAESLTVARRDRAESLGGLDAGSRWAAH